MFSFGATQPATTQPAATTTGGFSFGSTAKPATPAFSFGGTAGQQPSAAPSGASPFGATMQPQQQPQPASAASTTDGTAHLQPTSKYNDLSATLQKKLDDFQKLVQDQRHSAQQLDVSYTQFILQKTAKDIEALIYKFSGIRNQVDRDTGTIQALKAMTVQESDNVEMAHRLFESMMKQGGPGAVGIAERPFHHSQDYIWRYFVELAAQLETKLTRYRALLDDVEKQLVSLLGRQNGAANESMSPQVALEVTRTNYDAFLALAAKVANVHDRLEREKEAFLNWRSAVGSLERNPFEQASRSSSGGSSRAVGKSLEHLLEPATFSEMAQRIAKPSSAVPALSASIGSSQFTPSATTSTQQTAPTTSLMFGTSGAAGTGLSFGQSQPAAQQQAQKPASSFSFGFGTGTQQTQQPAPATSGFSLGGTTTQQQQPPPTQQQPTTTSGFGFGGTQLQQPAQASTFGFGANQQTQQQQPQPQPSGTASGFSFGGASQQQQPATGGFSFGGAAKPLFGR